MVTAGHKLGEIRPLFTKLDQALIDQFKAKYGGNQKSNTSQSNQSGAMSKEDLEKAIKIQVSSNIYRTLILIE